MKKLLSVLLFYPLFCSSETIELSIQECNGGLLNKIEIPFPLLKNDTSEISGQNIKLSVKFIKNIENDYRLKISLSDIDKKESQINLNTEILIPKNKKIPLGGYCSNETDHGRQYFLNIK